MAFVDLIQEADAPPKVAAVYRNGKQVYGTVLETWKAIAHNPDVLTVYLPYVRAVFGSGPLAARTRDLVAVRVCALNGCRYSLSHRVASARRNGVTDDELSALAAPTRAEFSDLDWAVLSFAEELTLSPPLVPCAQEAQAVRAETLAAVKAHLTDAEIVDLATTVGLWNALTRFHRVLDLDLDMPPPPGALLEAKPIR